ncbi:hypothetical protein GGF44_001801 [Coemansia sp. RSA 1694]|nr:hypothetical protein GGF44_001801 [Coemansia sp. RSA 1694]
MIAKRLGIEKDEFMFKGREKKSCHELDPDTPFAKVFYSSAIISRIESGAPLKPLHIELNDNPEYKGKTGMLRWILSHQPVACYGVYCEDEDPDGMLASRFAQSIAAYKTEHNIPPVPLVSEDDENDD